MKSEYSYKQGFYKVTLMGHKAGQDLEALKPIINHHHKFSISMLLDNWDNYFGQAIQIAEWAKLDEENYLSLAIDLGELGAEPEVKKYESFELFENAILAQDFTKRNKAGIRFLQDDAIRLKQWKFSIFQFQNDWYSGSLRKLEEYAFELWAKAENIEEAYRVTILPSFENSQVIRIYRKEGFCYFLYKVGQSPYKNTIVLEKQLHEELEASLWEKLQTFMDEHFWTAETWFSHYGFGVLDGTKLLFEGWKDKKYKFLDDHSPKKDAISAQARLLFEKIKTQAIGL